MTTSNWIPKDITHYIIRESGNGLYIDLCTMPNSGHCVVGSKPISGLAKELAISDVCQQISELHCGSCGGIVMKGQDCDNIKCATNSNKTTLHRCANDPVNKNKYHREIKKGVFVDVYDVMGAFSGHYTGRIKPMVDHLLKKLLAGGERGHKDLRQDMMDVRDTAQRAIDTIDEWV